jgi:hypothetical protein
LGGISGRRPTPGAPVGGLDGGTGGIGVDPADQLLAAYSAAMDSIAANPPVIFLPHRSVSRNWDRLSLDVPRANFLARVLAEMHVASRVDAATRRAQRLKALSPDGQSHLDLDRWQGFLASLRPVTWRLIALWTALLTLAVAFPVAWGTDYLRVIVPQGLVCNHGDDVYQVLSSIDNGFAWTSPPGCQLLGSGPSLVKMLDQTVHVNLNPGGVVDTVLTVRTGGAALVSLLVVVLLLCLTIVLSAFRSGFKLKRMAFSRQSSSPDRPHSLLQSSIRAEGVYELEREVFASLGTKAPREFPLDLVVSAGWACLPLLVASTLAMSAGLPHLGAAAPGILAMVAASIVLAVAVRIRFLFQAWRSREGANVLEARERWLPDGSTVLVRKGYYPAILLAAGQAVVVITALAAGNGPEDNAANAVFGTLLVWPLATLWSLRVHLELRAAGRSGGQRLAQAPWLCLMPPLCMAAALSVWVADSYTSTALFGVPALVGVFGIPVGIFRLARDVGRLQSHAGDQRAWKTWAAGLAFLPVFFAAPWGFVLYTQRALNQMWREIGSPEPPPAPAMASTARPIESAARSVLLTGVGARERPTSTPAPALG